MTADDKLYPFQRDGVRVLVERPAVLLGDEMGLGKTVQTAVALARLAERGELTRAAIIAPRNLIPQWRRALEEWAPRLSAIRVEGGADERAWRWRAAKQVYLLGYEVARNDIGRLRERPWDVVILDEAQRVKNRDSETARLIKRIPRLRSWALTGTPLENREDDLASVLEFVAPNPDGQSVRRLSPGPMLGSILGELQLRRKKADVLTDLPPKTEVRVPLTLGPSQRESYLQAEGRAKNRLHALGESATVMNVLELIARLKRICNACPRTGESTKLDDLSGRMEDIATAGHRALIFSQWTNAQYGVARITEALARFRPLAFTGAMDTDERNGVLAAFDEDGSRKALVLSLRAGGQGLNLQQASYVVHFDRWWNPAIEDQATDRAHRSGQTHPVTVYAYACTDTIEERIETILGSKRALFRSLVDGVSMPLGTLLSPEELFGLFDMPAPARLLDATAERSLTERVLGLLRDGEWSVTPATDGDLAPSFQLSAERTDEFGRATRLAIAAAESTAAAPDPHELQSALATSRSDRAVLALPSAPPRELADAADRAGVELWCLPP